MSDGPGYRGQDINDREHVIMGQSHFTARADRKPTQSAEHRVGHFGWARAAILGGACVMLAACGSLTDREERIFGQRFDTRVPLSATLPNAAGEVPVIDETPVDRTAPI
ncbi:MAG: hypothetical protein AAFQ06_03325, partial [Pseudomonadota bacterium]